MRARLGSGLAVAATLAALWLATPVQAQDQDLKLRGPRGQTVTLKPADVAALPEESLKVEAQGKTHVYQGPRLSDLLRQVGAPYGPLLHSKAVGDVIVVSARDGFVVALALADTDPDLRKDKVILADKMDGQPLPENAGPYRLVIEGDAKPMRSVRMVTAIEVRPPLTAAPDLAVSPPPSPDHHPPMAPMPGM